MLSVNDALVRITDALIPLPAETIALADAAGRVLAEDVISRRTQPPVPVSAMDGYAVRAEDVAAAPVALTVVGAAPAGGAYDRRLGPGQAVRIFTGGPVPEGADSIVMQELTETEGTSVKVNESVHRGEFVRRAGLDFSAGDPVPRAGQVLTARAIGLIAAMDVPWVSVRRRPKVALLANGDELVRPGEAVGANQIISSNTLALAALIQGNGGEAIDLGIARDDPDSLRTLARNAKGADLLITLGGASVGDHDLVQSALGDMGLDVNFWKIAMRPGKPLIFGRMGDAPMLGLPGNPVSALVCGLIFVIPALRKLLGQIAGPILRCNAVLGGPLPANGNREAYLRGTLERRDDGNLVATLFDLQDSSVLSGMAGAGCLVVQPPLGPARSAGDAIEVIPFPEMFTNI
ncbi:MAG: molybdopterin molybdotransferase MoeA [Rhodospirillales bacterium]|nr:molybdopterin molybdotransferase MoeA [Rhodospirillales bacterium]